MFQMIQDHRTLFSLVLLIGYASGALGGFLVFHFGVYGDARRLVRAQQRSQRAKALRWPAPTINEAKTLAPPPGSSLYDKKTVNVSVPSP
jgi:hypothetical protein